jgi:multidrug efflux system membrane fusion protein
VTHSRLAVLRWTILLGGLAVLGCNRTAPPPAAPPPATVTVARPVLYPVQAYFEYNGYLDAIETVQIKARVKGILEKIHFNEGDDVVAGAPLYDIDPREYQSEVNKAAANIERSEADSLNADAQIKLAKTELARLEKLGTAAAATEVDKAVATVSANEAMKKIAQANKRSAEAAKRMAELELEYAKITAPIAGRISRTLVTQGNLVGQNETTLLTSIVRMDKVYVYFDAPERDLKNLQERGGTSQPAKIPVAVGLATEEGFPHKGVLDFRENRVDTGTGTIRVRGLFDNPPKPGDRERPLYPGLFARVRVPNGPEEPLPVIPEEAVQTGGRRGRSCWSSARRTRC